MSIKRLAGAAGAVALLLTTGTTVLAQPSSGVPFKSSGSGTETSLSQGGCQGTQAGCVVQSTGEATSSHMGRGPYTSTLTVLWVHATSNGDGGFCAPASGVGTITAANGDTLNQTESGTVCEVGPTGQHVPHTFTGTFTNTGGTGRFASATGGGTVTGGDNGTGQSYYSESGTINY